MGRQRMRPSSDALCPACTASGARLIRLRILLIVPTIWKNVPDPAHGRVNVVPPPRYEVDVAVRNGLARVLSVVYAHVEGRDCRVKLAQPLPCLMQQRDAFPVFRGGQLKERADVAFWYHKCVVFGYRIVVKHRKSRLGLGNLFSRFFAEGTALQAPFSSQSPI